ncbi:MAG: TrmB family transcriptional regulator [Haloarculaceae archaeon]
MTDPQTQSVELLQELGLKQYEAECFVALTRMPQGTARDISGIADVPRTRVYDAVDALESRGLVEVQHSNPQQFRAIDIEDAVATLRERFASRIDRLGETLATIEPSPADGDEPVHEVWTLTGSDAITTRLTDLLASADEEVIAVLGDERTSEATVEGLAAVDDAVEVTVGVLDGVDGDLLREWVPNATVFESGLQWLASGPDQVTIGRLAVVDRSALLLTTVDGVSSSGGEQAVLAEGVGNGLVVMARRMLRYGLDPA